MFGCFVFFNNGPVGFLLKMLHIIPRNIFNESILKEIIRKCLFLVLILNEEESDRVESIHHKSLLET